MAYVTVTWTQDSWADSPPCCCGCALRAPRLGLQTVIVCLMLCYALLAPIVAGGHAGGLIFVAGLLLPLTLVGA
jgi:hypothetical protein